MEQVNRPPTILIVDDDRDIRKSIADFLTKHNYKVNQAKDTSEAEKSINASKPDMMLLDIDLPKENGIDFCKRINHNRFIPTIMLTASDDDIDRVMAYELGADHYMTKPFNLKVLLATIKALLRRNKLSRTSHTNHTDKPRYIVFNEMSLDLLERVLIDANNLSIELTTKEFELLLLLIEAKGNVLSRNKIIKSLYHRDYSGYDRNIDIMIGRIRKKIEDNPQNPKIIKTIHGTGYVCTAKFEYSASTAHAYQQSA